MARLFQPTFKASNLSVPNIPGADVGAFGQAINDIKLRDIKQRQLEVETQKVEEQLQQDRANRAQLQAEREYMKSLYSPSVTNTSNNTPQSSALTGGSVNRLNSIDQTTTGSVNTSKNKEETPSTSILSQEDVKDNRYRFHMGNTLNPELAKTQSELEAKSYPTNEQLISQRKDFVNFHNKNEDRRLSRIKQNINLLNQSSRKNNGLSKKGLATSYGDVGKNKSVTLLGLDTGERGIINSLIDDNRALAFTGSKEAIAPWALDMAINDAFSEHTFSNSLSDMTKEQLEKRALTLQHIDRSKGKEDDKFQYVPEGKFLNIGSLEDIKKFGIEYNKHTALEKSSSSKVTKGKFGASIGSIPKNVNSLGVPTGGGARSILNNKGTEKVVAPEEIDTLAEEVELPKQENVETVEESVDPITNSRLSYAQREEAASIAAGGFTGVERARWRRQNPRESFVSVKEDLTKLKEFLKLDKFKDKVYSPVAIDTSRLQRLQQASDDADGFTGRQRLQWLKDNP